MKRVGELLLVFIIVLSIVYMKPVLFPKESFYQSENMVVKEVNPAPKTLQKSELVATGAATYVGMKESELLEIMPNYVTEWVVAENKKWLVYGMNEKTYLQIEIRDGIVSSVFSLGSEIDIAPFSVGMTLSDVAEVLPIDSYFEFVYDDKQFEIELTEDDMNYRPLVVFTNGTYALLHFNYDTGELYGIRYLDKKTLLELSPYQSTEEIVAEDANPNNELKKQIDESNAEQLVAIVNVLRQRDQLEPYQKNSKLAKVSQKALLEFSEKPESVFEKEERLILWEDKENLEHNSDELILESAELTRLIKLGKPFDKQTHGLFTVGVKDVPLLVTSWYGNRIDHGEFMHSSETEIGVTFNMDQALILMSKEDKIKTSESSE